VSLLLLILVQFEKNYILFVESGKITFWTCIYSETISWC